MSIEVKQMTIRSTVLESGGGERDHIDLQQALEEMKEEILAECRESIEQCLRRERER